MLLVFLAASSVPSARALFSDRTREDTSIERHTYPRNALSSPNLPYARPLTGVVFVQLTCGLCEAGLGDAARASEAS